MSQLPLRSHNNCAEVLQHILQVTEGGWLVEVPVGPGLGTVRVAVCVYIFSFCVCECDCVSIEVCVCRVNNYIDIYISEEI